MSLIAPFPLLSKLKKKEQQEVYSWNVIA
jgi:hypothetical protein